MSTAIHISKSVREGSMSATDAVQSVLTAIKDRDRDLAAFVCVCDDYALKQAEQVDALVRENKRDLPLAGVPIAIKDNICTDFAPTTCASRILKDFRPPYSAHVTEKLIQAGAIIVGKTNLDEFAMGSSTENSASGTTRNPWDRQRVPGGETAANEMMVVTNAGMFMA